MIATIACGGLVASLELRLRRPTTRRSRSAAIASPHLTKGTLSRAPLYLGYCSRIVVQSSTTAAKTTAEDEAMSCSPPSVKKPCYDRSSLPKAPVTRRLLNQKFLFALALEEFTDSHTALYTVDSLVSL